MGDDFYQNSGLSADIKAKKRANMPMVAAAISIIAGIIMGRFISAASGLWLLLSIIAAIACFYFFNRNELKSIAKCLLCCSIAFASAANITISRTKIAADNIAGAVKDTYSRAATVEGTLLKITRLQSSASSSKYSTFERNPQTLLLLDTDQYTAYGKGFEKCSGLLNVRVDGLCEYIPAGSRLRVSGIISPIGKPRNPQSGNLAERRRTAGIYAHMYAATPQLVSVLGTTKEASTPLPAKISAKLKSLASDRLVNNCDSHTAMTLNAIVLGNRDSRLNKLRDAMVRSGTAHLLSISGLHLAILAAITAGIFRLCGASPRLSAIITLVMLAGYILTVQTRAPVLRGTIILAGGCAAVICGRRVFSLNLLAAACSILLIADPAELFRPGFQLSFGVTAGLIGLYRPVRKILFGRLLERASLMVFDVDERFTLKAIVWRNLLPTSANLLSASVAAFTASVPLVWFHFGIFTPLAPIASVILLPLAAMLLFLGYLKLALVATVIFKSPAELLNGPIQAASDAFSSAAFAMADLGLYFELPPHSAVPVIFVCAAIITFVLAAANYSGRKRIFTLLGCLITIIISTFISLQPDRPKNFEFTLLDVRNGQAAMLHSPSGKLYIFDAGSRSLADPYSAIVKPYMQSKNILSPAAAFISHADSDHYNAIAEMLFTDKDKDEFTKIYTSDLFGIKKTDDDQLNSFTSLAQSKIVTIHCGQTIKLEESLSVKRLYPPDEFSIAENENELSMTLLVECGGKKILLPGDLQELGQKNLAALGDKISADIMVLPHHGSWTGELKKLINTVDPQIVLRSSARRSDGATKRITDLTTSRDFYSTDRCGAITLEIAPETINVHNMVK